MESPKNRKQGEVSSQTEIDILAKKGLFKTGDAPGTDTYDDGMNEAGKIIMPGSTSTGSGGIYMEDTGPNDLRHKATDMHAIPVELDGLSVRDADEGNEDKAEGLYAGEDAAAKWLRENDPNYRSGDAA